LAKNLVAAWIRIHAAGDIADRVVGLDRG